MQSNSLILQPTAFISTFGGDDDTCSGAVCDFEKNNYNNETGLWTGVSVRTRGLGCVSLAIFSQTEQTAG